MYLFMVALSLKNSLIKNNAQLLLIVLFTAFTISAHATTNSGFDALTSPNIFAVTGQEALTIYADTDPAHNPPQPRITMSGPIVEGGTSIAPDGSTVVGSSTNSSPLIVNGNVVMNGNVGIGSNAPIGKLDIENGSNTANLCLNGGCIHKFAPVASEGGIITAAAISSNNWIDTQSFDTTFTHDLCIMALVGHDGRDSNCFMHGAPGTKWGITANNGIAGSGQEGTTVCGFTCYDWK